MRHPVNSGDIHKGNLSYIHMAASDLHVMMAKEKLKEKGLGLMAKTKWLVS